MTTNRKGRPRIRPEFVHCQLVTCGKQIAIAGRGRKLKKYCSRECYRKAVSDFDNTPYPQIWHNGKRIYLHRLIFMQAHPEIELTPDDIIHHKDENPYNREPDNLELIRGDDARLQHLIEHNFHRGKTGRRKKDTSTFDPEFGF